MQVANTRESLILALKNDKNSERWNEFVNQYWDYLHYAACKVDASTGRRAFIPDGVDPDEAVEQTFWQLKNIILKRRVGDKSAVILDVRREIARAGDAWCVTVA